MKEGFVEKTLTITVRDTEVPAPQPGQVLIRVVVSGTNPKDWKLPHWYPDVVLNQGDDASGYIEAVGEGVLGFRKGDRVAGLHQIMTPHGSYAEYAITWAHTTFHVPENISLEEAATIPLAAFTAAMGLYQRLKLPLPWNPTTESLPLIVYGGATAVGAFAIKFATLSNIHPLIVIAGRGAAFVESLIDRSKGDTIIDYREGNDAVRSKLQAAAAIGPIHHAYDAVSEKGSHLNIGSALTAPATITAVLPSNDASELPEGIVVNQTKVTSVHDGPTANNAIGDREFGAVFATFIGRGLAQGWFSGHPHEVRPGGLNGLAGALQDLEAGKASGVKYVVRIAETDGVNK